MGRPKLPINRDFPLKAVVCACAVEPEVLDDIKNLVKTGKRGRPRLTVSGKDVVKILNRHHATCAMAFFKEIV
jgi:hypothetical protein